MLEAGTLVYIADIKYERPTNPDVVSKFGIIYESTYHEWHGKGYNVTVFGLTGNDRFFRQDFPFVVCDLENKLMKLVYETYT